MHTCKNLRGLELGRTLPNSCVVPVGHPSLDLCGVQMSFLPRMHGSIHISRSHALKSYGMIAARRVTPTNDCNDTCEFLAFVWDFSIMGHLGDSFTVLSIKFRFYE